MSVGYVLIVVLVVVLLVGFGGWPAGPWYGGDPRYVGGGLGLVLLVVLFLVLLGRL